MVPRQRNVKMNTNKKSVQHTKRKRSIKKGDGIIDKIIDHIPIEMHIPGYQYCGPGIESFESF